MVRIRVAYVKEFCVFLMLLFVGEMFINISVFVLLFRELFMSIVSL